MSECSLCMQIGKKEERACKPYMKQCEVLMVVKRFGGYEGVLVSP